MTDRDRLDRLGSAGQQLSRRNFITGLTGAGLMLVGSPFLLDACGSSSPSKNASPGTTAAGGTTAPAGQSTKTLRMAQGSAPEVLDPHKTRAGTDFYFEQNVFEYLMTRNTQGQVVPQLATSYTMSPDGLQYTFTLRPGVVFHNGEPFDANAVKFSFERYVNPATKNVFSFYLSMLKTVDVLDTHTVRLNLSTPCGNLIDNGGFVAMVPPNYITKNGDAYFGQHPVGTGPFKFASYAVGQSWSLTRFDQYWGAKPAYAGVDTTIITADASRLAALESGQVDFITQVNPTDVSGITSRGITVKSTFSGTAYGLFWNMNIAGAPWQKTAVRQALNYALDRTSLRRALFLGYSIDYSKGLTQYEPGYSLLTYPDPPFDTNKAKQLLASAGYPKGFTMDIVGPADGRFVNSTEVMEAVAGQWADVGVKANVQALAYSQWIDALASSGNYHGIAFGDQSGIDPTTFYQQYFGKSDYSHASTDPHMNSLVVPLSTATGNARAQAAAAAAAYNNQQQYMIPLYGDEVLYGMKGVNWTPWATNGYCQVFNASPA